MWQRILRQNLAANRVANVTVMRRGLGRASGDGDTLDDLQLERLDWLKCAQGAQALEVLAGGDATLWRLRPRVLSTAADDAQMMELARCVQAYGYRCFRIETALFSPDNFNRRDADLFDGRKALSLLAIPEEIDTDMALAGLVEL